MLFMLFKISLKRIKLIEKREMILYFAELKKKKPWFLNIPTTRIIYGKFIEKNSDNLKENNLFLFYF